MKLTALAILGTSLVLVASTLAQPPFQKAKGGPKVGDQAPDFALKFLERDEMFKLSSNFGKRPTVLLFHSFT